MAQKADLVMRLWYFIHGDKVEGQSGCFDKIHQFFIGHACDKEALAKVKLVLSKYDVHINNDMQVVENFPCYYRYVHTHLNMQDAFLYSDEEQVLIVCRFLAKTHSRLENAITPGIRLNVAGANVMYIKQLQDIVNMCKQEISHVLSDLQTPAISDMADRLLTNGSDCVGDEHVFVDDEKEWANVSHMVNKQAV